MAKKPTHVNKFAKQLGSVSDFVDYTANLERQSLLSELASFKGTDGTWTGKRYLLVKRGGVVDFRHFFAAMMQRLEGAMSKSMGLGSTSEGTTLLLGVLNEVAQCIDEATEQKLNSCFAREDLISNRLGAHFGEHIVITNAEASSLTVAARLRDYLNGLQPMDPSHIAKSKMQSNGDVALEAASAVLKSISDALIPSAY